MPGRHRLTHRSVLTVGAGVTALLVALHGINGATADVRFFSLDQEGSLPSWVRILLFFVAGCACATAAYAEHHRVWLGLAGALVVFSLDDYVQGHEWLEAQTDASVLITFIEPLAALGFIAVIVMACRRLDATRRRLILTGSFLFAVGFLASAANDDRSHVVTVALSTIEQVCEAAFGWFVLAAALQPALVAVTRWAGGRRADAASDHTKRVGDHPTLVGV